MPKRCSGLIIRSSLLAATTSEICIVFVLAWIYIVLSAPATAASASLKAYSMVFALVFALLTIDDLVVDATIGIAIAARTAIMAITTTSSTNVKPFLLLIFFARPNDLKKMKSLHGLTRTLINNMVVGVTQGYEKKLEVNGVGYRAAKSGNKLTLSLGYSHPVEMIDPEGIETVLDGQNIIIVKGIDKEKVGQFAAEIRDKRRPEPYKGKGIKYADETIRRKVGKTGKK